MTILKSLMIAAAIAVPAVSMAAKAPSQGDYSIGGLQSICIVADGTWYGETFPAWGGRWSLVGKTLLIHGNYSAGAGNDAWNFTGSTAKGYTGDWQEWTDDGGFTNVFATTMTYTSAVCGPPAASVRDGKTHPAQ